MDGRTLRAKTIPPKPIRNAVGGQLPDLNPYPPPILPLTPVPHSPPYLLTPSLLSTPHTNLASLNNDPRFHTSFSQIIDPDPDPENEPPAPTPTIQSQFHDTTSFTHTYTNTTHPIIISINIQSLQSKHLALQQFIHDTLHSQSVPISIIALQEVWTLQHPEQLSIEHYKLLHNTRPGGMRGGGVGFYVHEHLNAEITHNINIQKVFECITIKVKINGKNLSISSVYRSPTPPPFI